ncbi:MAG: zinc-dependent metalloprotease family protein [Bryobacterales bacterium]|nr:zinc-dependent metalloprotease family protein [Bryobacterales bacterium]
MSAGTYLFPFDPIERLRSRSVGVDRAALKGLVESARNKDVLRSVDLPSVELNLFADTSLPFFVETVRQTDDGVGHVLSGAVGFGRDGHAIITIYQGAMAGSVRLNSGEFYQLFVRESGLGDIEQCHFRGYSHNDVDFIIPDMNDEAAPAESPRFGKGFNLAEFANAAPGDSIVDVLIAYTVRSRDARGGTAGMLAHLNQVIAESNTGLANSNVKMSFRLVHAEEVAWDDTLGTMSYSAALNALRSSSDGQMDSLHSLRDQYGADVVSLFVNPPPPGSGSFTVGLAYMLTNSPTNFAGFAFSIVHQGYAGGSSLTFPHEIGHNLGLNHDAAHSTGGGLYADSLGYQQQTLTPKFYTVMAYSSSCDGCTAINYFSNPNVSYSGIPVGISGSADSARTLEIVRTAAAGWRAAPAGACSYSLNGNSTSIGSAGGATAANVISASGCSWTATSNAAWITVSSGASGSGNGTVGISVAQNTSTATRTGTLTIAGQTFTVQQADRRVYLLT